MSKLFQSKFWAYFLKYGIVLVVILGISFLFPDNVKFKYQFERGRTWKHEELAAPFDFPIRKTTEQLAADRERLEEEFSPYYKLSADVVREVKKNFERSFTSQLEMVQEKGQFVDVEGNPETYLRYGKSFLDRIYERGVIKLAEPHADKSDDFVINVVRGNTTRKQTLQSLYTKEEVLKIINDSLPYSSLQEPDFLLPILPRLIIPNVTYDRATSEQFLEEQLASVSQSRGVVKKGELIVPENGIITDDIYQKLVSYRAEYQEQITQQRSYKGVRIGYFLLTSLVIGVFLLYLEYYAKEVFERLSRLVFVLLWLVLYSYLVFAVEQANILSAYIIPFCIVPIIIKNFFNDRLAIFTHIVVVLIASFLSSLGYEFTFIQILAGIVAVLSNMDTRDWSKFFYSIGFIFITYALSYLGLSLIQEGTLETIDWQMYNWLFINVFLTLLVYPLIPLLERLFGFTSSISLIELSDMNRPLLRELALQAPGTWQHSLQVANLAEGVANEVGADPLLVRVAALYHDIGKMKNPEFFIENQNGNNPHEELSNLESAKAIIAHVPEGEKLARKYRLPKLIIDFIHTHHGTTRTEYFYRKHLEEFPAGDFDESLFRYEGSRPWTREQTLLMLADSLEAACKSLKNPTGKDIDELVDKVINGKIANAQLEESDLSFHDLDRSRKVFKQLLRSIHHVRVEYPKEKEVEKG